MTPSRSPSGFGRAAFQVLTGLATIPLFRGRLRPVVFRLLGVTIGPSVVLGPGLRVLRPRVLITTAGHDMSDPPAAGPGDAGAQPHRARCMDRCPRRDPSVRDGRDRVGRGRGVAVTRDCTPHGLYAGVPARRVRGLHTDEGWDTGALRVSGRSA